jgi:hypothetical protein
VLDHSSGAIAKAQDTLVKHGDAELTTEKPRRFRLVGAAAARWGPGTRPGRGHGAGDDMDLAGAA